MSGITRRHALIAPVLGIALSSFAIVAEGPATPEPKVVATIAQPANQNGACLIRAEIRDPQSNRVLAAPHLAVKAGEQANFSSAESDRKVEVTFEAGPGCASGTYAVKVWVNGKVAYSKNGTLEPKAQ
jgi:hypothetical protein